jgi:chromate reductase, NAD(P)H dehydrogenase (quinone)
MSSITVLALTGSTRRGSSNTAVLQTLTANAPGGVRVVLYEHLAELPHFSPDDDVDPLPAAVADLRQNVANADAIIISTPEYAGSLPGSFKNLLDWLVGGTEISGKPIGWINVATPVGRAAATYTTLHVVLGYLGTRMIDDACVSVPVGREQLGDNGTVSDPALIAALLAPIIALAAASGTCHVHSGGDVPG